jgi:hypothetical protein
VNDLGHQLPQVTSCVIPKLLCLFYEESFALSKRQNSIHSVTYKVRETRRAWCNHVNPQNHKSSGKLVGEAGAKRRRQGSSTGVQSWSDWGRASWVGSCLQPLPPQQEACPHVGVGHRLTMLEWTVACSMYLAMPVTNAFLSSKLVSKLACGVRDSDWKPGLRWLGVQGANHCQQILQAHWNPLPHHLSSCPSLQKSSPWSLWAGASWGQVMSPPNGDPSLGASWIDLNS